MSKNDFICILVNPPHVDRFHSKHHKHKLQTNQGQVFDTRKHYLDRIGAVPTNLTYGENVVNYICPCELLHTIQSIAKLASKIPIKERQI